VRYDVQLVPGRPLSKLVGVVLNNTNTLAVFDNWRVLHGRSAFTGKRRMSGGYSKPLGFPMVELSLTSVK